MKVSKSENYLVELDPDELERLITAIKFFDRVANVCNKTRPLFKFGDNLQEAKSVAFRNSDVVFTEDS